MKAQHLVLASALVIGCSSSSSPAPAANDDGGSGSDLTDSGASGDTWENYAAGFFTTYCTSCHDPQDPTGRDFNVQAIVLQNKADMRCGVAVTQDPSWSCPASITAKQFPIGTGPKPTDAERNRLVAWIAAGEP
ncbi:MAG: hypothetical protein ACRELY_33110 [Polyangiaceae bacterium]